MKKFIISILTIVSFSVTIFALPVNECKTDIYFGNGVFNTKPKADISRQQLNNLIQDEIIRNNPTLKKNLGKVKLAYNWGQGNMLDVLETYYQLKKAGQVNDMQFFAVMDALTGGNLTLALGVAVAKQFTEQFTKNWEQGNVDEMLIKYYNESFQYSHRVLLVSHSQGNLFANRVYDSINPAGFKDYFANVQVASPASSVHATMGTYITGSLDPVINPIPGSMSSNADLDFLGGHTFVSAYLDSSDTYGKIVTAIRQELVALINTSTQWEIKQELNYGTKDYRIKVKHRFDSSITVDSEVFPFEPSKKLYQVKDTQGELQYVKAGFGGTQILDENSSLWTDRKPNQFYKLEGTDPIEYIVSSCDVSKIPIPKRGVVNVQLTWGDKNTNMDLDVVMPNGIKDIEDVCLPIEHFSVMKQKDIKTGIYKVYVRHTQGVIQSKIPQEVHLAIDTPSKAVTFDFNITSEDMLNLGYVADIVISEQKEVTFIPKVNKPSKVTHYISSGGHYASYIQLYIQYNFKTKTRTSRTSEQCGSKYLLC